MSVEYQSAIVIALAFYGLLPYASLLSNWFVSSQLCRIVVVSVHLFCNYVANIFHFNLLCYCDVCLKMIADRSQSYESFFLVPHVVLLMCSGLAGVLKSDEI